MWDYHAFPDKSGIYKFTCLVNNKIYIGKAKSLFKRIRSHLYIFHSSSVDQNHPGNKYLLYRALKKYGVNNFIVEIQELLEDASKEILESREKYWIEYLDSYAIHGKGYNEAPGGEGGNVDQYLTDDKKREKYLKVSIGNKNKKISNITRQRLSDSGKGRKQSPEWIEKRISKLRGRPSLLKGKKQPERGPWILSKEDQRKAFLKNTRTLCLKFTNNYTGEIRYFYGCQEASRIFNIHRTSLNDVIIRGEMPRKGFKKKFFDEWKWEIILRDDLFTHRPDLVI
jgi:group I intron endonuclease